MRRRWKILIFVTGGLLALIAVCFFFLPDNEPSYNGRTLSQWLDIYDPAMPGATVGVKIGTAQQRSAAEHAIAEIGTNALPFVLKWTSGGDNWRRPLFYNTANSLPGVLRYPMQKIIWKGSAARRWEHAFFTVKILRTNAEPILAELNSRFRSCKNPNQMPAMASMIAAVGPEGIRCLADIITESTGNQRRVAMNTIKRVARGGGTDVKAALRALLSIINDPRNAGPDHRIIRVDATNALETIAPEVLTNKKVE